MIDLRPIVYIIGRILIVLALLMLGPAILDLRAGLSNGTDFIESAVITGGLGVMVSLATRDGLGRGLDVRQAYLLTLAIWSLVPLFAALPLILGAPGLGFTDAYFEAVSGITTTGSSVIVGLESLPNGTHLWRATLNWLGGLGIAFVAMIFLPVMRVGGMQFFRIEGFDTFGKALPRATDIAWQLLLIYAGLTLACGAVYASIGMSAMDATVYSMASIATGGFAPTDTSFNKYGGVGEYAATLFMVLASLPFVRYVQLVNGKVGPLWRDAQVWGYLRIIFAGVGMVVIWRSISSDMALEPLFRQTLFNLTSILSGTGFSSGSFSTWGGFGLVVAFAMGLIGGCSGSSSSALSVFRIQITLAALFAQIRQINSPSRVSAVKYEGRAVDADVLNALMAYIAAFVMIFGLMSVACTLTGVDMLSSLFAVWASLCNIGYTMGPVQSLTGTLRDFPDSAKWIMIIGMLMGRLGVLSVLVIILPQFWRR